MPVHPWHDINNVNCLKITQLEKLRKLLIVKISTQKLHKYYATFWEMRYPERQRHSHDTGSGPAGRRRTS